MYEATSHFDSPRCHIFDLSNKNQVKPGDPIGKREITDIIMHHTACHLLEAFQIFSSGNNPFVNVHYIVTETGAIIKMAKTKYVVRHAGISKFVGREGFNLFSIGIELVNPGFETNGYRNDVKVT